MSEEFDAYHKWLGIPPKEQPPNYYRLLGIDLFESDKDVIVSTADMRMSHIREKQSGKRSTLALKIRNEISAARVCLLDPEQKADYDEQLRQGPKEKLLPPPLKKNRPPPLKKKKSTEAAPTPPQRKTYATADDERRNSCITCGAKFVPNENKPWTQQGYCSKVCGLARAETKSIELLKRTLKTDHRPTITVTCPSDHKFDVMATFAGCIRLCPDCGAKCKV